ncbi:MAG: STAS/SEC14 domain-containing protein [Bacteroidales bacterium]
MEKFLLGENEIYLKPFRIFHVVAIGDQTEETGAGYLRYNEKALRHFGGRVNFLIDMNRCGKISPKARRIFKQLGELETTEQVAVFGAHPMAKLIGNMVLSSFGKDNARFFDQEEQAMEWVLHGMDVKGKEV